jgi:predicted hydrocarbon binding protein
MKYMHGTIFFELKKYVETKLGREAWDRLLSEADLGARTYEVMGDYPDSEVIKLTSTASRITGMPVRAILEDFGEFIAPDLLQMYGSVINPDWKTLDVIEHTESQIHSVVRLYNRDANPPALKCVRTSENEVVTHYSSQRKMCDVAKGIVKGLAKHYQESISISESTCMLKGDPTCTLLIKRNG